MRSEDSAAIEPDEVDDDVVEPKALERTASSILLIVSVLLGLGLVMVYSATAPSAGRASGMTLSWQPLVSQAFKLGLGLVAFAIGAFVPTRVFVRHHRIVLLTAIVLLGLVLIPGVGAEINKARRWIPLGSFFFQPMEFARIALIVWISATVVRLGPRLHEFQRGLVPVAAAPALIAALLLREPDFGSAVFLFGLSVLLLLLGGARVSHFLIVGVIVFAVCVGYAAFSLDHVQARFQQFLHPGPGSQSEMSQLALGSGGVTGVGLGAGMTKLGYLPMVSSDFVLAAIGEELGFAGTSLVLLLFLLLTLLMARVATAQRSRVGFLMCAGITLSIAVQVVINIAVVTGAAPTKGIALPFLSAGGSAVACSLFAIGMLVNLARHPDPSLDAEAGDVSDSWTGRLMRLAETWRRKRRGAAARSGGRVR